jgi:hypothetical protein
LGRTEESEKLGKLIDKYFFKGDVIGNINHVCKNPVMNISTIIKVTNFLNLLTGCLLQYVNSNKTLSEEEYEKYILFSITWSIGGVYEVKIIILFNSLHY